MWRQNPDANVAICIPKDCIVADIDSVDFIHEMGPLPQTIKVNTPREGGGMHLWYRIPNDLKVSRRLSILEGLDILNSDGYVVAPNSTHPSGNRYRWAVPPDSTKEYLGIAECPTWLLDLVVSENKNTTQEPRKKIDMEHILYGLKSGERQEKLYQAACSMRGRNVRYEEAYALLKIAAENATPPYEDRPITEILDRVYTKYTPNETKESSSRVWKVSELLSTEVGETQYYVDGLLPQGAILFSSDPKMGKSMILANISKALALGRKALGKYETKQCAVLYMDLEQGEVTAKPRWEQIIGSDDVGDNLYTVFKWLPMDIGGFKDLEDHIKLHPEIKVVIIDVLAQFMPTKDLVSGNAYQKDYAVMSKIAKLAKKYAISIICVHHNTKNHDNKDFIKSASGSMGLTAAADTIWVLDRARNNDYAQLKITGKNIKEGIHYLQSYNDGFSWYAV
jgi:hypothetical protein